MKKAYLEFFPDTISWSQRSHKYMSLLWKKKITELFEISVKLENTIQSLALLPLFRWLRFYGLAQRDVLHKCIHWLHVSRLPAWRVHGRIVHNICIFVGKKSDVSSTILLSLHFLVFYKRLVFNSPAVSIIFTSVNTVVINIIIIKYLYISSLQTDS